MVSTRIVITGICLFIINSVAGASQTANSNNSKNQALGAGDASAVWINFGEQCRSAGVLPRRNGESELKVAEQFARGHRLELFVPVSPQIAVATNSPYKFDMQTLVFLFPKTNDDCAAAKAALKTLSVNSWHLHLQDPLTQENNDESPPLGDDAKTEDPSSEGGFPGGTLAPGAHYTCLGSRVPDKILIENWNSNKLSSKDRIGYCQYKEQPSDVDGGKLYSCSQSLKGGGYYEALLSFQNKEKCLKAAAKINQMPDNNQTAREKAFHKMLKFPNVAM